MGVREAIVAAFGTTTMHECGPDVCTLDNAFGYNQLRIIHYMECEKCGCVHEHVNGEYERCPYCGRRIVE